MKKKVKASLILENGTVFNGNAFGYIKETVGEVVFTTGMTGYQETLTDPSFAGQIVTMTYPLIGNYGINLEDNESDRPYLKGFIVRENCEVPNNWRCEMNLEDFLKQHKVTGLEGIDTRMLTKLLRQNGTMKGIITTRELTKSQIEQKFNTYTNKNAVREVIKDEPYFINGSGTHFAVLDCGIKSGIIRSLANRGCKLSVFPAYTSAEKMLSVDPDAIFLGNGPGDPLDLPEVVETVKELIASGKPILGICLGHQLISLALGCKTERLKFGHHGGNHPVKDLASGTVYITSQNHNFVVSDLTEDVEPTFINVNDGSIEGIKHKKLPIYSVQFHPEANPGPLDTGFLFDRFIKTVEEVKTHAQR
ncbi:MAG: glutamine-hydrolyzing carbamoyl-phosphate synthase small subunit [Firmicutes bacterium]|nr:glutamine-hydrolyzing carbamoyl-phosphate synthase small subunit [Bacillota bacterium]